MLGPALIFLLLVGIFALFVYCKKIESMYQSIKSFDTDTLVVDDALAKQLPGQLRSRVNDELLRIRYEIDEIKGGLVEYGLFFFLRNPGKIKNRYFRISELLRKADKTILSLQTVTQEQAK